jgi:hypothetical protein
MDPTQRTARLKKMLADYPIVVFPDNPIDLTGGPPTLSIIMDNLKEVKKKIRDQNAESRKPKVDFGKRR